MLSLFLFLIILFCEVVGIFMLLKIIFCLFKLLIVLIRRVLYDLNGCVIVLKFNIFIGFILFRRFDIGVVIFGLVIFILIFYGFFYGIYNWILCIILK